MKAIRNKIEAIAEQPEVYGSRSRKGFREAEVEFSLTSLNTK
jgi:hypothetical protein